MRCTGGMIPKNGRRNGQHFAVFLILVHISHLGQLATEPVLLRLVFSAQMSGCSSRIKFVRLRCCANCRDGLNCMVKGKILTSKITPSQCHSN